MIILLTIVFITILVSAQCSLYESALYSTRLGLLEAAKNDPEKEKAARSMIQLKRNISVPIAAILILNTVANTAGATFAGLYAGRVLGASLVPIFSVLFTLAILLFAEIIPKTLGAVYWRKLWPVIVTPLKVLRAALGPAIIVVQKLNEFMTRGQPLTHITEEEIVGAIRLGARHGEITHSESRMVQNIINLEEKTIADVMTPRNVVFSLDETTTVREALEPIRKRGFSRIPVYRDDKENITGYVLIHDLAAVAATDSAGQNLSDFVKQISFVSHDMNCLSGLTRFLRYRIHLAVVEDSFGGVAGLVTLEDLIETVLGSEIVDETDRDVDMQKVARKKAKRPPEPESRSQTKGKPVS